MPDSSPPTLPLDFVDPDRLLASLWARLESPAFRTQSLATIGLDGAPRSRNVVVRRVDAGARTIACHADVTSPKIAEIRRDPRCAWAAWDDGEKFQLRLESRAAVHADDAIADAMWASQRPANLDVYRIERPSSTPVVRPEDAGRSASPDRARFAVICARLTSLEWLSLADAKRHRRGRFTFADDGAPSHVFLVP